MLQLLQAFGGPGRIALGFTPTYSMYPDYCRDTFTDYVTAERADDFGLDAGRAAEAVAAARPRRGAARVPEQPDRHGAALDVVEAVLAAAPGIVVVDEAYAEFRRPGSSERADPARPRPAAGRHPHDEQGVRVRRRPGGLPGRRPGGGRRRAAGPAAVPPVGAHPGGRPHRPGARRTSCWPGSTCCAPSATTWSPGCGGRASRWPTPTPTSSCSAASPTGDAVWQGLLDRGVLIRETGPEVSCGSPPAPRRRTDGLPHAPC